MCRARYFEQVKPWTPIGNMGSAVHMHALENGYTVVKEIGGHGVGLEFHEDPWVSYTSEEEQRRDHGAGNDLYH